jgi:hypothetical protein
LPISSLISLAYICRLSPPRHEAKSCSCCQLRTAASQNDIAAS